MNTIEQDFPGCAKEYDTWTSFSPPSYEDLLTSRGAKILVQVDDDDYQGDSRFLLVDKETGRYGWTIIGWGSCSGCDALQAVEDYKDLGELRDEIIESIAWFDTLDALKERFHTKDWEVEYSWHAQETKDFVEQILKFSPTQA